MPNRNMLDFVVLIQDVGRDAIRKDTAPDQEQPTLGEGRLGNPERAGRSISDLLGVVLNPESSPPLFRLSSQMKDQETAHKKHKSRDIVSRFQEVDRGQYVMTFENC